MLPPCLSPVSLSQRAVASDLPLEAQRTYTAPQWSSRIGNAGGAGPDTGGPLDSPLSRSSAHGSSLRLSLGGTMSAEDSERLTLLRRQLAESPRVGYKPRT